MILECCVNSAVSAIEAQSGGADRVELCDNMAEGGTTPGAGTIKLARERLSIALFVMIRPRGADFLYSDAEFRVMQEDIIIAKAMGADGVVFGLLTEDGNIDKNRMDTLIRLARPMGVTCHRAFDMTRDPFRALEDLIGLGADRILTSGQAENALAGAPLIRQLLLQAGNRISIMPGHGIREHNIEEIAAKTGAKEFHMYLTKQETSRMRFTRGEVSMGNRENPEYSITIADRNRIRMVKEILKKIS